MATRTRETGWQWADPAPTRVEAAASRIRSGRMNERDGDFRLDAVAQTAVLLIEQQLALRAGETPGQVLHAGLDDSELVANWMWMQQAIGAVHPWLFPSWPEWSASELRRWIDAWWGVDMIGAHGPLQVDTIAVAFQMAASMSSKQHAWGAFHTPYHVCYLMALVSASDTPWLDTVHEPCVGAGSMLVATFMVVREKLIAAQEAGTVAREDVEGLIRGWMAGVSGQDIDPEAVWTASVNLAVRTGVTVRSPHPYRSA